MNQFFWDVTLQGADQKKIDDWLRDQLKVPQRPGAIRAHNESVLWTPQAPKLEAGDAAEDIGQIKSAHHGWCWLPVHLVSGRR
jgi:hypothetical protein